MMRLDRPGSGAQRFARERVRESGAPHVLALLGIDTLAGLLGAVLALSYAVGYGAMIFSAGLSPWLSAGMPTALISCVVVALPITLRSSVPFMLGGPDSNSAALLAGLAAGIATDVRLDGGGDATGLATVLVALALASLVSGALLYALAHWNRGNAIQYVPFPVVGGFLAGTGLLIVEGAIRIATGAPVRLDTLPLLLHLPWLQVAPALLVGVGLLVLTRISRHVVTVPLVVVLGVVVFYTGLHAMGMNLDAARHLNLLFEQEPVSGLRLPVTLLREASFAPIFSHATEILAVAAVCAMTVLLNTTSIGVATSRDVDFNRELRVAGIANLLTGVLGGIVGSQSMSRTLMSWRIGAMGRRAGLIGMLLCVVVIGGYPGVIALFPKPVLVGLQLYLGGAVLIEWLVRSFRRLPWHDYLLIPLIMVIIAAYGIVAGVALGVVAACLLFVVRYGRVNCIRVEFGGSARRSHVERTVEQNRLLDRHAAELYGIGLQGFLFFGTAYSILTHIRGRIESPATAGAPGVPGVRFVLVDFSHVHGVDASSTASFARLIQVCGYAGAQLVLTGLPGTLRARFRRSGIGTDAVHEFADLDGGLEWIEERVLERARADARETGEILPSGMPDGLLGLRPHLETIPLEAGAVLFRQGDPGDAVYFVDSGRVTVTLALADGRTIRLRSYGAGTIVGEMAVYTGARRSAGVAADRPTVVLRLALATLRRLEQDDPALASQFHAFVVKVLAARLAVANEQIRAAH